MKRPKYDVFLSHDHNDSETVDKIGRTLTTQFGFKVWLDKWILVPGRSWQQAIAKGLDEAATCAVCIGKRAAQGWFQQEVERALNLQASRPDFRVIPVLLPDSIDSDIIETVPAFVELRTWADFRPGLQDGYAIHLLKSGIQGVAPGPWPPLPPPEADATLAEIERDLQALDRLKPLLHEIVLIETQRRIVSRRFT